MTWRSASATRSRTRRIGGRRWRGMRRVAREDALLAGLTSRTWERPQEAGGGRRARRAAGDGPPRVAAGRAAIEVELDGEIYAERLAYWPFVHQELDADLHAPAGRPRSTHVVAGRRSLPGTRPGSKMEGDAPTRPCLRSHDAPLSGSCGRGRSGAASRDLRRACPGGRGRCVARGSWRHGAVGVARRRGRRVHLRRVARDHDRNGLPDVYVLRRRGCGPVTVRTEVRALRWVARRRDLRATARRSRSSRTRRTSSTATPTAATTCSSPGVESGEIQRVNVNQLGDQADIGFLRGAPVAQRGRAAAGVRRQRAADRRRPRWQRLRWSICAIWRPG